MAGVSPEQEALDRIERAIKAYEEAGYPVRQLDAYRKLVADAAKLRLAVQSQRLGKPISDAVRIMAENGELEDE